jgi:hypothetical protein
MTKRQKKSANILELMGEDSKVSSGLASTQISPNTPFQPNLDLN